MTIHVYRSQLLYWDISPLPTIVTISTTKVHSYVYICSSYWDVSPSSANHSNLRKIASTRNSLLHAIPSTYTSICKTEMHVIMIIMVLWDTIMDRLCFIGWSKANLVLHATCSPFYNIYSQFSLFSEEQYFDSSGFFIFVVFAAPIILNCLLIVVRTLTLATCVLPTGLTIHATHTQYCLPSVEENMIVGPMTIPILILSPSHCDYCYDMDSKGQSLLIPIIWDNL